jgi:Uma2 family endonuclease
MRGDEPGPRIAYLEGELELMTPSKHHERVKSFIGRLVETYAVETGLDLSPYGGWLLKEELQEAGAEPDECYIIGPAQDNERPDLVIEVVWTSGRLDKLEIYRRLGVREVWWWTAKRLELYVLRGKRYVRARRSAVLPDLDLGLLMSFLDRPSVTQAIRAYRTALAGAPAGGQAGRRRR